MKTEGSRETVPLLSLPPLPPGGTISAGLPRCGAARQRRCAPDPFGSASQLPRRPSDYRRLMAPLMGNHGAIMGPMPPPRGMNSAASVPSRPAVYRPPLAG